MPKFTEKIVVAAMKLGMKIAGADVSQEEAVQALGRNIRLLVSITEPLHCRNAARGRDHIRKGSDMHGPPLPLCDQCHIP